MEHFLTEIETHMYMSLQKYKRFIDRLGAVTTSQHTPVADLDTANQ